MSSYDPELERLVKELNQKATVPAAPVPAGPLGTDNRPSLDVPAVPPPSTDSSSLDGLLRYSVERGASDIILVAGSGLVLRVNGKLAQTKSPEFSDEEIRALMLPLLNPSRRKELDAERSVDFSFVRKGIGRFRTNIHFQRGALGATIRILPASIPTIEELCLPASLKKLTERKQGLVLVTGPAGSGKTTTLAALIGLINQNYAYHIVTIEDPIEYHHRNERSVVEQIEVGHDATTFAGALRSILRQSPDVILVGEMRDPETMAAAVTAAETGHLVLSTLHTNDTIQAVGRVVDGFPPGKQNQIRQQLSLGLLAIIAQQLVPSTDGARRYPALEILVANTAVRNLIRKGEDHLLRSQLSLGRSEGMVMMEESLDELVRVQKISRETALAHCFRPDELQRYTQR
jgi:twitching motility protein PilT